jgi:hypothetical protein
VGAPHGGQTARGSVVTAIAVAQLDMLAMQTFAAKRIEPTPCQTRMRATERFSEEPTMTKLEKVLYTAKAHTTGGREGASRSDDGRLEVKLSSPGAPGTGINPEQLFAAGWSACFIKAMRLVAGKMKVAPPLKLGRPITGAWQVSNNLQVNQGRLGGGRSSLGRHWGGRPAVRTGVRLRRGRRGRIETIGATSVFGHRAPDTTERTDRT